MDKTVYTITGSPCRTAPRGDIGSDRWTSMSPMGPRVVHPFNENMAYGFIRVPVLIRLIQDDDEYIRTRALYSLRDCMIDPLNVYHLNETDAADAFRNLVTDTISENRLLLADALKAMTISTMGRDFCSANNMYQVCLDLMKDSSTRVKGLAAEALDQATLLMPRAIDAVKQTDPFEAIISQLPSEPMLNQEVFLRVLHNYSRIKPLECFEAGAVDICLTLLKSPSNRVKENAATVLMDIAAFGGEGREKVAELGGQAILLELCHDEDIRLVAKALGALMMIANCTAGKLATIDDWAVEHLIPLLENKDLEARLNCLKALTALAEAHHGRRTLKENIGKVLMMKLDTSPLVQRAVDRAVQAIQAIPE